MTHATARLTNADLELRLAESIERHLQFQCRLEEVQARERLLEQKIARSKAIVATVSARRQREVG